MVRIIDANHLIGIWRLRIPKPADADITDARQCADESIRNLGTNALVTPVVMEFLAGIQSRHELRLADEFLTQFAVIDAGHVYNTTGSSRDDWSAASRPTAAAGRWATA
jgi:hypothetical protein